MNNIFKYWFFYIKPEFKDLVYTEEDSSLYGYTDNKEYSKLFKEQRDMNKFIVIKKEISKEEVNFLAREYPKEYLIKKTLKTKSSGMGSKIVDYDLVMTRYEELMIQTISYKVTTVDIFVSTWMDPKIFDDKYYSALKTIGYNYHFNILNNCDKEERKNNKFQPDLLSTFIRHYGFLLAFNERKK